MAKKIALILVVLVLIWAFFIRKRDSSQELTQEEPPQSIEETQSEKRIFKAPREPLPKSIAPEFSEDCQSVINGVLTLDFDELGAFPPVLGGLPQFSICDDLKDELQTIHQKTMESCQKLENKSRSIKSEEDWEKSRAECFQSLFYYRAQLGDYLTKGKSLSEIKDPRVLADTLIVKMNTDPSRALQIAARLSEIDPNLLPAKKAEFLAAYLVAEKESEDSPQRWHPMKEALDKMSGDEDLEVNEMQLQYEILSTKDLDSIQSVSERVSESYPESGTGPYYLGWVANQKGQRQEAIAFVRQALQREPNEPRYQETLARLESAKKSNEALPNVFFLKLSFNFSESWR